MKIQFEIDEAALIDALLDRYPNAYLDPKDLKELIENSAMDRYVFDASDFYCYLDDPLFIKIEKSAREQEQDYQYSLEKYQYDLEQHQYGLEENAAIMQQHNDRINSWLQAA